MKYDKLRKLPKVIQMEIWATGDITLLSDEQTPMEELVDLWANLEEEFKRKYNYNSESKYLNLNKEIEYQQNRYDLIIYCCQALEFEYNPQVHQKLKEEGYSFSIDDYKDSIVRICREANGIKIKINKLKDQLPKPADPNKINTELSIIDIMAAYSSILGISFDFNTLSVEAFHSYEAQVKAKIKNIEKQNTINKFKK